MATLRHRPHWKKMTFFLASFIALHFLWQESKGTWIERLWIDQATVKSAAGIINIISPETHAYAEGTRVRASGGGLNILNILNGCEGTDALLLLISAYIAFPMAWRHRVLGLSLGIVLTFTLNEMRVVVLFFAARSDKGLFDLLHTTVAPVVLVALIAIYFYAWVHREPMFAESS